MFEGAPITVLPASGTIVTRPRLASLSLLAALALGQAAHAAPAPTLAFDPVAFFAGRSTGEGRLKKVFSAPQATHVVSAGKVEADGTLMLDQTVRIEGEKVRQRQWRLRKVAPDRFEGTLSDARGPVVATQAGGVLNIAYTDKSGFAFRQQLTLEDGGRRAHNLMKVRRFGLTVAMVDEIITRD